MKSVSAIIPNFNGRDLLEKNLPTLINELKSLHVDYEVIVVDDYSTDDSVEFLKKSFNDIIIIEKAVNEGFSATCNVGIQKASKELIFLMNSDIILTQGYFEPQFKYFDKPDTFGVMGKVIGYYDDGIQDTAKIPIMKGAKLKGTINYLIEGYQEGFWTPSFYLSGANALVNAKKLKAMGGFDEIFSPFYYEDMDLGVRAQRLGWKCYYEHNAICRHEGSVTTKKIAKYKVDAVYLRNRFVFHALHFSGLHLLLFNVQTTLELLFLWVNGRFGGYLGFIKYLGMRHKIKQSRLKLKSLPEHDSKLLSIKQVIENMNQALDGLKLNKF